MNSELSDKDWEHFEHLSLRYNKEVIRRKESGEPPMMDDPTRDGLPKYPLGLRSALVRRIERSDKVYDPILKQVDEIRERNRFLLSEWDQLNEDAFNAEIRKIISIAESAREKMRWIIDNLDELGELFPGNKSNLFSNATELKLTDGAILPPGRLLLDVTDATLFQVKERWTSVYWEQIIRKEKGNSQKRMPGRPPGPATEKTRHWVGLSRAIGEKKALNRFKKKLGRWQGNWIAAYQWWYRNVRRHLNK